MDEIHDTVLEYWVELSKSWASPVKAIQHYRRNPEQLAIEVEAVDKLRKHELTQIGAGAVEKLTADSDMISRIWEAMDEIRQFGRAGLSLDEIRRRTLGSANAITGNDSPWADFTIRMYLEKADRERLFGSTPPSDRAGGLT